ncbi:hypothetical protein ElyMa_000097500 [Elysia marginata]|uniref:Uncharacterized protein n=1 Tax=Elysia marginata TaxID=1093978 RepID=A0AAV4EKP7_9GAST|nr:hypothetical protein ElyMa_000097500 [Elysia marginata]
MRNAVRDDTRFFVVVFFFGLTSYLKTHWVIVHVTEIFEDEDRPEAWGKFVGLGLGLPGMRPDPHTCAPVYRDRDRLPANAHGLTFSFQETNLERGLCQVSRDNLLLHRQTGSQPRLAAALRLWECSALPDRLAPALAE